MVFDDGIIAGNSRARVDLDGTSDDDVFTGELIQLLVNVK